MFEPLLRRGARALWHTARALDQTSLWLHLKGYENPPGWRALIARNRMLRNRYAGRRAFVIGNGPSINGQDLRPLADEVTFVSNAFWRHPAMRLDPQGRPSAWQPTFYSIIDPLYADGSDAMRSFFAALTSRVTRGSFLVSAAHYDTFISRGLLPRERACACLLRGNFDRIRGFEPDLAEPLPGLQSVALLGILAAMYMGCSPVVLIGMDHDWLASPTAQCAHFYEGPSVEKHDEVRRLEFEGRYDYRTNLEDLARLFRAHERLRDMATRRGVHILNATRGGYLDVYPRACFEDMVIRDRASGGRPATRRHGDPRPSAMDASSVVSA